MKAYFKFLTILLTLSLFSISIVGCTPNQDAKEATSSPNTKSESKQKTSITLALQVANIKEQEPSSYAIVQEFMKKYPDIIVTLEGSEKSEHIKKMKMMAQSDNLPDIFWMSPAASKELFNVDKLLDLSSFVKENGLDSRMDSNYLKANQLNGKQFGLPYQVLAGGFWYNKALFDKYKLEVPTTYEDLKKVVATFNANKIVTIAQGSKTPHSVWGYLTMISRYGFFEKIDNINNKTQSWNNPDFLNFYQKLEELAKLGAFPENLTTLDYYQAVQMFLSGEAAILNSGVWESKSITTSSIAKDVDFWWGPTFSDGVGNQKLSMIAPSSPLVVSKNVEKNKEKHDAVMKFLNFYYSDDATKIMIENGKLPIIKYNGQIDNEKNPILAKVINQMNAPDWTTAEEQPDHVTTDIVTSAMYDSIHGVMSKHYTPDEAIKVVEKALNK